RHIVRAEPLILAHGRLERPPAGGGTINVLVREIRTLDEELAGTVAAPLGHLPKPSEEPAAGSGFRAVAPPVQSFASGRRR
ncbi:MAG TPA: hypothetical protein VIJ83_02580, partial [Solirubrobacteraceae bacterium]